MSPYILLFFVFFITVSGLSICSKYTTSFGQAMSVLTDPSCSTFCRVRNCGAGRCRSVYKHYGDREDRYECVCDQCQNPRNVYGNKK